ADPNRDIHLGVQHVLSLEMLHQPISNELIVLWRSQVFGERLEGHQKTGEIFVLIKRFRLSEAAVFPMPVLELYERLRRNRTFEMQVQLSFRECADEWGLH